jgi:hypothetical protein
MWQRRLAARAPSAAPIATATAVLNLMGRSYDWRRRPSGIRRTTENAPPGKEGRFWGYYREERYVSLYMLIRGR